jgi:hypothetical protein
MNRYVTTAAVKPKTKIKNHLNTYIIRSLYKLSSQIYWREKKIMRKNIDTITVHLLREKFYKILLSPWYMPCRLICQCVTYQHNRHERRRHSARRALSKRNGTQSSQVCRLTCTVSRVFTFAFEIFIKHVCKHCTSLWRKTSDILKLSVPNTWRNFRSSLWKVFAW